MRYTSIDATDTVVNIVEWDGKSPYSPPDGQRLVPWQSPAGVGSVWNGSAFTPPPQPPPAPPMVTGSQLAEALTEPQAAALKSYFGTGATPAVQAWWSSRYDDDVAKTAPKLVRIAARSGIDLDAWFAAAMKQ